jgi:hypothetical protein
MRERRKSKEKNIREWSYAKRKMAILRHNEFFGILLAA